MKAPFKVSFWFSAAVMMLTLAWMAWRWSAPVKRIITGDIFWYKFTYVYSSYTAVGDSFNVGVNKVLIASLILFSVVVAVLGPLRWITAEMTELQQRVFGSLGVLLGMFPLSAAVVALVAISRLMIDMGVTARRLWGLGCASGAILAILGFLWLVLRFRKEWGAGQCASPSGGPTALAGGSRVTERPPTANQFRRRWEGPIPDFWSSP